MIEDLIRAGRIREHKATRREIDSILNRARKDINVAGEMMAHDWDWCFAIAYNAVLQASRAFMFSRGFRSEMKDAHKNTFAFMKEVLGDEHAELIMYFDRMRVKRNRVLYDIAGIISETEARNLIGNAKKFVAFIAGELSK